MRFKIHIDGVERSVEASADGSLVIDGERYQAKISNPGKDRRVVQVGDGSFEIRTVDDCSDAGIVVLEVAGERVPLTITDVKKGGAAPLAATAPSAATAAPQGGGGDAGGEAAAEASAPEEVKDGLWAPVPGKIVDVRVKAGDKVAEGDIVLILEAMKMENELHATKAATVAAVLVKKGDQAERGQLLVAFE